MTSRRKLAPFDSDSPAVPTRTRSAANEVYLIPELRRQILQYLNRQSVEHCLRVFDKAGMMDCARILYRKVAFSGWMTQVFALRGPWYCPAISIMDASAYVPPVAAHTPFDIFRVLTGTSQGGMPGSDRLPDYTPADFRRELDTLVPLILDSCSGIREIIFGQESEAHFQHHGIHCGHIEYCHAYRYDISSVPPAVIESVPAPGGYTLSDRFDLQIRSDSRGPTHASSTAQSAWLAFLRSSPHLHRLYKVIDLSVLRVEMADLERLYRWQIDAEHDDRLETIFAPSTLPAGLADWSSLAKLAGASLTSLQLASTYLPEHTQLSFADLPALVQTIRTSLPKLVSLELSLSGVHTAEADCQAALSPSVLDTSGSIRTLRIHTPRAEAALSNVLRVLYPICAVGDNGLYVLIGECDASLEGILSAHQMNSILQPFMAEMRWNFGRGSTLEYRDYRQTDFLRYLASQPLRRRKHLAVADFTALGIVRASDFAQLQFHADGRIKTRHEVAASERARRVRQAYYEATGHPMPIDEDLLAEHVYRYDGGDELKLGAYSGGALWAFIASLPDELRARLETEAERDARRYWGHGTYRAGVDQFDYRYNL